jgi:hypothetical protein
VARTPPPDFLFGRPKAALSVRGGLTFARAGSDWYDFVTDQLTLQKRDFRSGAIAADVGAAITPRLEVVVGVDYGSTTHGSEFRHFVDNNRLPINQTTELRHSTLTVGARFAVMPRGRELSSLAWIPRRFVPYVGAGGGGLWYRIQQYGDFVDFQDFSIYSDVLESSAWTLATYVNGGADVHLTRRLYITVDARYLWADAPLGDPQLRHNPWDGFEPLDLTGLRISTGLTVQF